MKKRSGERGRGLKTGKERQGNRGKSTDRRGLGRTDTLESNVSVQDSVYIYVSYIYR